MGTDGVWDQLREVLRIVWELFKRRPLLVLPPVIAFMLIAERERLNEWIDEATRAATGTRSDD